MNLLWSITSVLISAFIGALATTIIKHGLNLHPLGKFIFKSYLWMGGSLYLFSTFFYLAALQEQNLSVLYPIAATTYIWTTFLSVRWLGEKINLIKCVSLLGIIIGVVLIGIGS